MWYVVDEYCSTRTTCDAWKFRLGMIKKEVSIFLSSLPATGICWPTGHWIDLTDSILKTKSRGICFNLFSSRWPGGQTTFTDSTLCVFSYFFFVVVFCCTGLTSGTAIILQFSPSSMLIKSHSIKKWLIHFKQTGVMAQDTVCYICLLLGPLNTHKTSLTLQQTNSILIEIVWNLKSLLLSASPNWQCTKNYLL